ncbi:MAG: UDP-N-acetylmuramoyl-L-alanine--D-glutamate ligase [Beijerinckiaceae bacterium]
MTPVTHAKGKHIAVVGLGGSGLATARALMAGGVHVIAWDDNEAQRVKATAEGITILPIGEFPWPAMDSIVLAPGIPLTHKDGKAFTHEAVAAARHFHVEVIGDIELFCRERAHIAPEAPFVAITGTNGKSTTTALVAHILRACRRDVQMGGNIGAAILSLEPPSDRRVHVVECSSFQIDLAPGLHPDVGIFLNLTPDHLDRHGTIDDYWAIKHRLVASSHHAVIGIDDAWSRHSAMLIAPETRTMVSTRGDADLVWHAGYIYSGKAGGLQLASVSGIGSLRGEHNGQNAAAAIAACLKMGCTRHDIQAALQTFPGLAHRMEMIGKKDRVLFVNDSKATNADSTEKALSSFPADIYWIVGGKPKEGGIESLRAYFPRVAKAYLVGSSSEEFASTLDGQVVYSPCGTIDNAVMQAYNDAQKSDAAEPVVMLSPACASYDQFPNFEVRGDYFRKLAQAIIATTVTLA